MWRQLLIHKRSVCHNGCTDCFLASFRGCKTWTASLCVTQSCRTFISVWWKTRSDGLFSVRARDGGTQWSSECSFSSYLKLQNYDGCYQTAVSHVSIHWLAAGFIYLHLAFDEEAGDRLSLWGLKLPNLRPAPLNGSHYLWRETIDKDIKC